jgi:hypothetical protein
MATIIAVVAPEVLGLISRIFRNEGLVRIVAKIRPLPTLVTRFLYYISISCASFYPPVLRNGDSQIPLRHIGSRPL